MIEVVYIIRSGSEKFALQCEHKRESRYRRRCEFVAAAPANVPRRLGELLLFSLAVASPVRESRLGHRMAHAWNILRAMDKSEIPTLTGVERMIEIVRNYPILYDSSHEDYKNVKKKDRIWSEIGKQLNANGERVKKKWKNLRDTYAKYVRRNKTKSGQAANRAKKWVWADQMKAFDSYLTSAKTSSNVSDVDSETNTESAEDLENRNIQSERSENSLTGDAPHVEIQESQSQFTNEFQSPHSTPVPTSDAITLTPEASMLERIGRKRNSDPSSSVGELIKYFESERKTEYDAIDHIFFAYAKTIRTFSGRRQAITKMKIAQVIMEQELLHQEELASTNQAKPESADGCK